MFQDTSDIQISAENFTDNTVPPTAVQLNIYPGGQGGESLDDESTEHKWNYSDVFMIKIGSEYGDEGSHEIFHRFLIEKAPDPEVSIFSGRDCLPPWTSQEDTAHCAAEEIHQLRRRIEELELENARIKSEAQRLSLELLEKPSTEFQCPWRQRTEARIKKFCSFNPRLRRTVCSAHARYCYRHFQLPKNGRLTCGCTYEEVLFGESLARHRVGSSSLTERRHMDPSLRNSLLKLLQHHYNYKDGDFDFDPFTEIWNPGESPKQWVQRAQSIE